MMSQKNNCLQNKLEFAFFLRGLTAKKIFSCKLCNRTLDVTEEAIQMTYYIVND